jgi:hypothetical protein
MGVERIVITGGAGFMVFVYFRITAEASIVVHASPRKGDNDGNTHEVGTRNPG